MTPKKRLKVNSKLPARWRMQGKVYYYRVPPGLEYLWNGQKEYRLGSTLAGAYREYAARVALNDVRPLQTITQLCDRYLLEVVPDKAPSTQESNKRSIGRIREGLGHNYIRAIEPYLIYQYRDLVGTTKSHKHANLDLEVLSHMFTKAIQWGAASDHPMTNKKVTKFSLPSRDRYVEGWEVKEALAVASPFLKAYIELKGILGLRKGDMLSIQLSDIKPDGLHVIPRKTKHKTNRHKVYPITPELEAAIAAVKALKKGAKVKSSIFLFSTRDGQPYIKPDGKTSGFDSIWQRFIAKVLAETKVTERFTEHDLRAKVGSDQATDEGAQQLLDHSNVNTTRKTYRRKAVVVTPTKGFKQ